MSARTRDNGGKVGWGVAIVLAGTFAQALLLPVAARADPAGLRPAARRAVPTPVRVGVRAASAPRPVPPPVQKLIFTDDEVTAEREGGAGDVITVRQPIKQSSMIKIRAHFLPELLKSAEDM